MTDREAPSKPRRWLAVAFLVSLAANLFFAGLLIGGPALRDGPPPRERAAGADMLPSPRMFMDILGRDEGRRVLRELRSEVPDLRQKFRALHQRHQQVIKAMEADPYDEEALSAAFDNMRLAQTDLTSSIQKPLTHILADLTPQQRKQFAEAFRKLRRPQGKPRREPSQD